MDEKEVDIAIQWSNMRDLLGSCIDMLEDARSMHPEGSAEDERWKKGRTDLLEVIKVEVFGKSPGNDDADSIAF